MDFATALTLATNAVALFMKVEPVAAAAIKDFKPYVTALIVKFTGQQLTDAQRQEAEDTIDDLHSQFQAPIPPADQQ